MNRTHRQPPPLNHRAERPHHAHRNDGDRPRLHEVRQGRRILERVRRIGTEVATTVGSELFDGHLRRRDASGDGLLLSFERCRLGRACERHRRSLRNGNRSYEERQGQQDADARARHVDVEVTQLRQLIAAESADDGHQRGHAGGGRHELEEGDDDHLREIRESGLTAVVLQIGVGRKAGYRVERERRLHGTDAVRVERQHVLQ